MTGRIIGYVFLVAGLVGFGVLRGDLQLPCLAPAVVGGMIVLDTALHEIAEAVYRKGGSEQ